ncbi:hypothetical protein CBR_g39157 [Chara braunii]|uniref:HIT domain-containing protein n=1 Tax=Chara braunii TaxID=69332 RepID=A0A388LR25_CHABU|nr:hypothetical protein CBR_g39157 [Chara braunii]|eukprot:GBG84780.1 hypothetical protein CBR_g39157 [Chara braunii]
MVRTCTVLYGTYGYGPVGQTGRSGWQSLARHGSVLYGTGTRTGGRAQLRGENYDGGSPTTCSRQSLAGSPPMLRFTCAARALSSWQIAPAVWPPLLHHSPPGPARTLRLVFRLFERRRPEDCSRLSAPTSAIFEAKQTGHLRPRHPASAGGIAGTPPTPRGASAACYVSDNRRSRSRLIAMACSDAGHKDGDTVDIAETNPERKRLRKTETTYLFGPYPIHYREVFLETSLSYAFVNLKPVVPGHVLVSPKRVVKRFAELTSAEVVDLWQVAQRIARKLEGHHDATSLTLTIQDGKEAGQTVPHVHVHILPRKGGDFTPNDKVYDAIDESEEKLSETLNLDKMREDRTPEEMAAEAATLRALFEKSVENEEENEEEENGK